MEASTTTIEVRVTGVMEVMIITELINILGSGKANNIYLHYAIYEQYHLKTMHNASQSTLGINIVTCSLCACHPGGELVSMSSSCASAPRSAPGSGGRAKSDRIRPEVFAGFFRWAHHNKARARRSNRCTTLQRSLGLRRVSSSPPAPAPPIGLSAMLRSNHQITNLDSFTAVPEHHKCRKGVAFDQKGTFCSVASSRLFLTCHSTCNVAKPWGKPQSAEQRWVSEGCWTWVRQRVGRLWPQSIPSRFRTQIARHASQHGFELHIEGHCQRTDWQGRNTYSILTDCSDCRYTRVARRGKANHRRRPSQIVIDRTRREGSIQTIRSFARENCDNLGSTKPGSQRKKN